MILPIYIYGQPVLRKVAEDINADYPDLKQLITDMFETLTASDGVGLAGPQIGKAIRLVVIDLSVLAEDFPEYKISGRHISMRISWKRTMRRRNPWKRGVSVCLVFTKRWSAPHVSM